MLVWQGRKCVKFNTFITVIWDLYWGLYFITWQCDSKGQWCWWANSGAPLRSGFGTNLIFMVHSSSDPLCTIPQTAVATLAQLRFPALSLISFSPPERETQSQGHIWCSHSSIKHKGDSNFSELAYKTLEGHVFVFSQKAKVMMEKRVFMSSEAVFSYFLGFLQL